MSASGNPETAMMHLFEPLHVGHLTLSNRIVLSPMAVLDADEQGRPSAQTAAFLAARARGGVGLIIVGGTIASQRGFDETPYKGIVRADVPEFEPDLARVAAAVHAHDVPIIAEVMSGFGRMGVPSADRPLISASAINVVIPRGIAMPFERVTVMPREATVEEIKAFEDEMVGAALRLQRTGWDGIEIAAHASYFLASFLTPRTNWRSDDYGGSVANRARILVDLVSRLRKAVGTKLVIGLRLPVSELVPGGQGANGYAEIAKTVEAAGLDYVAPVAGCYEAINEMSDVKSLLIDSGELAIMREALSIPLIITGIHDPKDASDLIAAGHGDLVTWGRPMLADPDLPTKLQTGRVDAVIKCDAENYCITRLMTGMAVRCKLNPAMGREAAIEKGAPAEDRSRRRRFEDMVLRLINKPAVIAIIRASSAFQNRRIRAANRATRP